MIGCFVLMVVTEKKNAHEAHKEVLEKGGIKNFASWNSVKHRLHFLRCEDEEFRECEKLTSELVHARWQVGKFVAVDETIVPYNSRFWKSKQRKIRRKEEDLTFPSRYDLAPIVEMKSKPHSIGLLFYAIITKTKIHITPILLGMNIILNPQNRSTIESMYSLVKCWPETLKKPVLVADAAFSTQNSLKELTRLGWDFILSTGRNNWPSAAYLISSYNCKDGVIAVAKSGDCVLSVLRKNNADKKDRVKVVISSVPNKLRTKSFPHLEFNSTQDKTTIVVEEVSTDLDGEYNWTKFKTLKLRELKEISTRYSIPKTGTKAVLAKRVFNWLSGEDFRNQYKKLISSISNIKSHQSNSLHTNYYENFNSEDLFNKALLSSLGKLTFENWRCKLTYAVFMSSLLNAFAIFRERDAHKKMERKKFLRKAAKFLLL